jgi:hypothetical protein
MKAVVCAPTVHKKYAIPAKRGVPRIPMAHTPAIHLVDLGREHAKMVSGPTVLVRPCHYPKKIVETTSTMTATVKSMITAVYVLTDNQKLVTQDQPTQRTSGAANQGSELAKTETGGRALAKCSQETKSATTTKTITVMAPSTKTARQSSIKLASETPNVTRDRFVCLQGARGFAFRTVRAMGRFVVAMQMDVRLVEMSRKIPVEIPCRFVSKRHREVRRVMLSKASFVPLEMLVWVGPANKLSKCPPVGHVTTRPPLQGSARVVRRVSRLGPGMIPFASVNAIPRSLVLVGRDLFVPLSRQVEAFACSRVAHPMRSANTPITNA